MALERATGIEPAFSAWEADVLPLYDARTGPNVSPAPNWRNRRPGRAAAFSAPASRGTRSLSTSIRPLQVARNGRLTPPPLPCRQARALPPNAAPEQGTHLANSANECTLIPGAGTRRLLRRADLRSAARSAPPVAPRGAPLVFLRPGTARNCEGAIPQSRPGL